MPGPAPLSTGKATTVNYGRRWVAARAGRRSRCTWPAAGRVRRAGAAGSDGRRAGCRHHGWGQGVAPRWRRAAPCCSARGAWPPCGGSAGAP